jgi:hypothetical protein
MNALLVLLRSLCRGTPTVQPVPTFRPSLEPMEDRLVPSTLDLTAPGSAEALGGAIFYQPASQPTGGGPTHTFVALNTHHHATVEQGYNTDARPLQFDEQKSHEYTHALRLGDVPTVSIGGVTYLEFLLDVNQTRSHPVLSLDELRLYVGQKPNLHGYDPTTGQLAGLTPVYDLGAGGANTVLLQARTGAARADMFLYVPQSLFSATGHPYVYLYSKFGGTDPANGGSEEWEVARRAIAPPLGSLSGTVYFDQNQNGVFDAGDSGIAGVTVTLTGTNSLNQTVNLTTRTDANGFYSFLGLLPGTYTIVEIAPSVFQGNQLVPGTETLGTLGGTPFAPLNDFGGIVLHAGGKGTGYNFGNVVFQGGGS